MLSIREVVSNTVAVMLWEKEQATATSEERKMHYREVFASIKTAKWESEGDVVNAANLLGNMMLQRGWKADSIKVRRSEFRRIVEHRAAVSDDCSSWKAALRQIRDATIPRSDIIKQELDEISKRIEALYEKSAELQAELELIIAGPAKEEEIVFSDEIEEEKEQRKAA
jgi:hypothetical protein